MLRKFADFMSGWARSAPTFSEGDHRVATAALLVHAVGVDGSAAPAERKRLVGLMRDRFGLDARHADSVIAAGAVRARESVDLTDFTHPLKRVLDQAGLEAVVDMLWDVVLIDGNVRELEESFVWRVADLLGVSASERVASRRRHEGV